VLERRWGEDGGEEIACLEEGRLPREGLSGSSSLFSPFFVLSFPANFLLTRWSCLHTADWLEYGLVVLEGTALHRSFSMYGPDYLFLAHRSLARSLGLAAPGSRWPGSVHLHEFVWLPSSNPHVCSLSPHSLPTHAAQHRPTSVETQVFSVFTRPFGFLA
jgi:hypothetical protein